MEHVSIEPISFCCGLSLFERTFPWLLTINLPMTILGIGLIAFGIALAIKAVYGTKRYWAGRGLALLGIFPVSQFILASLLLLA